MRNLSDRRIVCGQTAAITSTSGWPWLGGFAHHILGFIDPLHSTGVAPTLFDVRRPVDRELQLRLSSDQVIDELRVADELVDGCYAALPHFRL